MKKFNEKSFKKLDVHSKISPFLTFFKWNGLMPFTWNKKDRKLKISYCDKILIIFYVLIHSISLYYFAISYEKFKSHGTVLIGYGWQFCMMISAVTMIICMFQQIYKSDDLSNFLNLLHEFDQNVFLILINIFGKNDFQNTNFR